MTPQDVYRWIARGISFLLLTSTIAMASTIFADTEKMTLALAQFDFQDTSGEVQDQSAEHEARLKSLNETLHGGLAGNQEITLVA